MNLSNQTYDFLNALVRYIMPALGTLYFALASIWGFGYAEQVLGTILALETFLGMVIMLARSGWKVDDTLVIDVRDPDQMVMGFRKGLMVEDLKSGQNLNLSVERVED